MRTWAAVLVLSFCLVPAEYVGQNQKYSHPGTIIDAYRRDGIMADAYAYASQTPDRGSDCPTYGPPLDGERSVPPSGSFTFRIDAETNNYLSVYCGQGYAPRIETINSNRADHTRVRPDPITLYPRTHPGATGGTVASAAMTADLQAVHQNFTYYAKADSKGFTMASASERFSDQDRWIISALVKEDFKPSPEIHMPDLKLGQGPDQNREAIPQQVAFAILAIELNELRSDFRYYAAADEGGYHDALQSFSPDTRKTIDLIRTRSDPFGYSLR